MKAFLDVLKREALRISESWVLLFSTIIGPLLGFIIIYWIFSAGVVRNLPVTIVDEDCSQTSRKLCQLVEASPVIGEVVYVSQLGNAKVLMDEGKTQAIIRIPKNAERQIFKGESCKLNIYLNNANLVVGGTLKSSLYKILNTVSAGIKMQVYQKTGKSTYQALNYVQPIRLSTHRLFNPYSNYAFFLALGLLPVMLTVFTFLGSVYALGTELKEGTAPELLQKAKGNIIIALTGKLLPYTVLFFMQSWVMDLVLFKGLQTPLQGSLSLLFGSQLILIVCYQSVALLFLAVTSNLRLSLSLGSAYTIMALTFSGLTFPTMAMPLIARVFSYLFPYTLWLKVFVSETLRGDISNQLWVNIMYLGIYFLLGLMAFPTLKKRLSSHQHWGKQ